MHFHMVRPRFVDNPVKAKHFERRVMNFFFFCFSIYVFIYDEFVNIQK